MINRITLLLFIGLLLNRCEKITPSVAVLYMDYGNGNELQSLADSITENVILELNEQKNSLQLELNVSELDTVKKYRNSEEILKRVNLWDQRDAYARTLSGGMRRRLLVAKALVHNPEIVILDEPTAGVDVELRQSLWNYMKELNVKGTTICLTTHYLEEADYLCDRIGIIDKGKIMVVDSPSRLKDELGGDIINIKINGEYSEIIESLKQLNYVKKIDIVDQNLRIKVEKGENVLPTILEFINSKGIVVTSVSLAKASLDQVFLKYTGKSLRDAESDKADRFKMYFTRRSRTR